MGVGRETKIGSGANFVDVDVRRGSTGSLEEEAAPATCLWIA
jgi:hypothetical protein